MHNQDGSNKPIYAGIEGGGTKFVCAVGTGPDDLRATTEFPTTTSQETLARAIAFLREQQALAPIAAIGIGTFGPLDLSSASPTYGYTTSTTKPGWSNIDVANTI